MPEMQWWYARGEEQFGPVSPAELRRLASSGGLSVIDLVWREGLSEWAPAARIKGLFPEAPAAPREPAANASPTAAPAKPAPVEAAAEPRTEVATQETAELTEQPASDPGFASFTVMEHPPGAPPVDMPPPPPPAPASSIQGATTSARQAARQRISYARLSRILTMVQVALWGICVLVILLGGLVFTWARLHAKSVEDEAASATVYGMFFIGAYVVARAGEKISRLVLTHLENRRG